MDTKDIYEGIASGMSDKAREEFLGFMAEVDAIEGEDEAEWDDYDTWDTEEVDGIDVIQGSEQRDAGRRSIEKLQEEVAPHNAFPEVQLITEPDGINKRKKNGMTDLHIAVMDENLEEVKRLLSLGADPTIKDHSGHTPADKAARMGLFDILAVFQ